MARRDASRGDDALLAALASGMEQEAAARQAGVSRSTLARRLRGPEFRLRLNAARTDLLDRAIGILAQQAASAAASLALLASRAESEQVRSSSARAVLELLGKFVEAKDMEERIAALEAAHESGGKGK